MKTRKFAVLCIISILLAIVIPVCVTAIEPASAVLRIGKIKISKDDLDVNKDKTVDPSDIVERIEEAVYQQVLEEQHMEPTEKAIAADRAAMVQVISNPGGFKTLSAQKAMVLRNLDAANEIFNGTLTPVDAYLKDISQVTKELRGFLLTYESYRAPQVQRVFRELATQDVAHFTSDAVLRASIRGDVLSRFVDGELSKSNADFKASLQTLQTASDIQVLKNASSYCSECRQGWWRTKMSHADVGVLDPSYKASVDLFFEKWK